VPATALPGEIGNVVLAGHRDSFFRPLKAVREGDKVTLTTPEGTFDYDVTSTEVVGPERTDLVAPSIGPTLTLITCYPFNYVGPAPDRFVVRALPAAEEAPAGVEPQ
jgi:sortase A